MATYKYQQNMFDGAQEGYVKYNITPDFGTPLMLGATIEISGLMYARDFKVFGIEISTDTYSILGKSMQTASKGVATAFTITASVTQALINKLTGRAENVPIKFTLFDSEDGSSGTGTFAVSGQELYVIKSINPPVITNVFFHDDSGAFMDFGYNLIQNKSKVVIELNYEIDTLYPDNAIKTVEAFLESSSGSTPVAVESVITGSYGYAQITLAPIPDVHLSVRLALSVTDKTGGNARSYVKSLASGVMADAAFNVYAYASPSLSTIEGKAFARRYDYKTDDYGEKQIVFVPEGRYVALSFKAIATRIPSGGNRCDIQAEYADEGTGNFQEAADGWMWTSNGADSEYIDDMALIPETHVFDPGLKYDVRLTLTDYFETAVLVGTIDKAAGYFHVTKYGVAANMRSTSDAMNPKNEFLFPFFAYQGVNGLTAFTLEKEEQAGVSIDGKQLYTQTFRVPVNAGIAASIPISRLGTVYRIDGVIVAENGSVWPVNCYVDSNVRSACYRTGAARSLTLVNAGISGTAYVTALYAKADTEDPTAVYLWNNGPVGYNWHGNGFTRPNWPGSASGAVDTDLLKIKLPSVTGNNAIPFNAHVNTTDVIALPAGLTRLNVSAKKTSATATTINFGLLPENAANSYSTANGGQLSGDLTLSTSDTVYTMDLDASVIGSSNFKCIINGKANMKNGTAATGVSISSVWFD